MKRILLISIFIFSISPLFSQNIVGNWKGNIDLNGNQIPIVFHFYIDSTGKIDGKWDSPKQNANGLPFSNIKIAVDSVHLEIKVISGAYEGKFVGEDSIAGMWNQGGGKLPLNFKRQDIGSATLMKINPANTREIFDPNEKEISVTSSVGSKIYGTLLSKNKDQKLAIIIAGSGPTDRNGNNPLGDQADSYKLLAYALDSQNIATFRYDKTGIGKSLITGLKESDIVFENSIADAERIFDYLQDTLGFKNIYFVGHSEGSLIGMVASQKKKVKGFISIAGLGRPFDVLINEQENTQQWPDSLKNKTVVIFNELKNGRKVNDIPTQLMGLFRKSVQPYLISLLKYSPEKEIKKLNCPVLILQGSCDMQVKIEDANNLHNANKKSTMDILPLMTHTLKDAGKNCEDQQKTYSDGSLPLNKSLVKDIADFIKK
jgi:pimeloyl-ACP methyl ester carboxylesterase